VASGAPAITNIIFQHFRGLQEGTEATV